MALSERSQLDRPTILAVGMVAYLLAKIVHEGLGHGGTCIAVGGDLRGVSSSWCACVNDTLSVASVRWEKANGTLFNLAVGLGAALITRRRVAAGIGGATTYFWWLTGAVQLFMGASYMWVDPIFGFGDWTAFLEGLQPAVPWRLGVIAVGAVLTIASIRWMLRLLEPFRGREPKMWQARGARLTLYPYAAIGAAVMTGLAALNMLGLVYALTSAAATIGGTSYLAWTFFLGKPSGAIGVDPLGVPRDTRWIGVGVVALLFGLWFGHGIEFGAGL